MSSIVVPKFVQEATSIPSWKVAMEEEMFALSQNASWALVFPPQGKLLLAVVECIL